MSSTLGIVIFEDKKINENLTQFWSKWLFLGSDEDYHKQKRKADEGSQINPYILPFDYGHFETNEVIHVSEVGKEKLEEIAFIITPDNEFLYYYDYEAADMSDYYHYQIYQKPSFTEVVERTMEKYKNCFVLFARCW